MKSVENEYARLSDFLCFTIYSTNLAYSRVYKPVLEKLGVTYPQYVAIVSLCEDDHQTVKSLSERLFLEPSTITPMLQRLEKMDYVSRYRDDLDERSVRIAITDKGRRLQKKALQFAAVTVSATGLNERKFRHLQEEVARLRNSLMASTKT
ncbi:MarR family transcriptional regulator [Tardiphaga alba]|uniref:MarR family transcriptional regulator n=1 Tax=Tardiphaga alba TaxID=340268 RepID=A0ABX8AE91_9BRAD|nr:MarR family transcriptional regulator [Tardiphaga alba]QUS41983.1 MarR family transcriptional regulator [Tardiphaga alba]